MACTFLKLKCVSVLQRMLSHSMAVEARMFSLLLLTACSQQAHPLVCCDCMQSNNSVVWHCWCLRAPNSPWFKDGKAAWKAIQCCWAPKVSIQRVDSVGERDWICPAKLTLPLPEISRWSGLLPPVQFGAQQHPRVIGTVQVTLLLWCYCKTRCPGCWWWLQNTRWNACLLADGLSGKCMTPVS